MFSKDMSKQLEFNVEYSPEHELAAEKSVVKPAAFEITSESIRKVQNVCDEKLILFIEIIIVKRFLRISIALFLQQMKIIM